jgi:hypothetical protein
MYNRDVTARRRSAQATILASISWSLCTTVPARANGRFPEAQSIETAYGGDASTVFVRTTFGILVSHDTGKTWRWICERALGYEGQWDPPITVTRDGLLWVGLEGGLVSTHDGCDLERSAELEGETVKDLTTDGAGQTLWAITGAPGKRSFVWRRLPGKRFERLAGMDETNFMTIEVAPSLPSRVYVSGQPYTTIRGQIFRSDDGGLTFKTSDGGPSSRREADAAVKRELETSGSLVDDGPFFIGAIDHDDPSRLLVRHLHAKGSDLYLTKDGGKTFKNVLSMKSAMFGFAKSPDGKAYWAGSGLAEHGIFRSTDRGEHFERIANRGVLCLQAASPSLLFVCENALRPGAPVIAVSNDQGRTTIPLARFSDVEGPMACPRGDARATLCEGSWPEMRALLAPLLVSDAGSDAGSVDGAGPAHIATPSRPASCGCEVVGTVGADLRWLIVGVVPLFRIRSRIPRGSTTTRPGGK